MFALIKKEFNTFFSSPIGYLVIGIFTVLNGLFLFVFDGAFNILNSGFAELTPFFELAPWVLLFLIPAVTMRSFSDELKMGTFELLVTKPLSLSQIVLGKYGGAVFLICIALIPSILYVVAIYNLSNPAVAIDIGSIIGSYIGLLFLVIAYAAIGIFSSTLSANQIVSFMIAVLLCFVLYYGFDAMSSIFNNATWLSNLSFKAHYNSVARGVLDTRDIVYFISVSLLFLALTVLNLKRVQ